MNLGSVVSYVHLFTASDKISWQEEARDLGIPVLGIARIKLCLLP